MTCDACARDAHLSCDATAACGCWCRSHLATVVTHEIVEVGWGQRPCSPENPCSEVDVDHLVLWGACYTADALGPGEFTYEACDPVPTDDERVDALVLGVATCLALTAAIGVVVYLAGLGVAALVDAGGWAKAAAGVALAVVLVAATAKR